jgi:hypothetical protein
MTLPNRTEQAVAFRELGRALARRRLAGADARLRLTVLAITAIVSGFAYWRMRVPLDGVHRARGAGVAALFLAAVLAALALAAAALAAARQDAMRRRPPGPEWLALPAPAELAGAHLGAEARLPALAVVPPAAACLAAGFGLVPPAAVVALALLFAGAWFVATGAAAMVVRRAAPAAARAVRGLPPAARWLVATPRRHAARRGRPADWSRASPARALARLDALASVRPGPARARLAVAGLAALAGLFAWFDGAEPLMRRAQAFAALVPVAAALGAWAALRACAEPPDLHRPLPIALRDVYVARAVPLALALLAVTCAYTLASVGLPAAARLAIVPAWWPVSFAVAVLGLHYGLTLVPRADAAEAVYAAWLGAALAASVMVPLLGWAVLFAGLGHSGARLRRWWTPEGAR